MKLRNFRFYKNAKRIIASCTYCDADFTCKMRIVHSYPTETIKYTVVGDFVNKLGNEIKCRYQDGLVSVYDSELAKKSFLEAGEIWKEKIWDSDDATVGE